MSAVIAVLMRKPQRKPLVVMANTKNKKKGLLTPPVKAAIAVAKKTSVQVVVVATACGATILETRPR